MEHRFDYRGSSLLIRGIGLGLPAIALAVAVCAMLRAGADLPEIWPFAAVALAFLIGALVDILRYFNESIIIDGSQLISRDLLGRTRLSVPLLTIPAQRCPGRDSTGSNERPSFTFLVHTPSGDFKVDSRFRGIDQLLALLERQGVLRGKATEFDYRRILFLVIGPVFVTMAITVAVILIRQRATGDMPYRINGKLQDGPAPWPVIIGFVALWSGGFGGIGAYLTLRAKNERITVVGDRIAWTDWLGRLRVESSLSSLAPGALTESVRRGSKGGSYYTYRVRTPDGEIQFDQYIRNSRDLIDLVREAADSSPSRMAAWGQLSTSAGNSSFVDG